MEAPNGTATVTFAITKLFLGDTDPDGTPDPTNGWKHFGYNIDGIAPTYYAGFCEPVGSADLMTLREDGIAGIQNAWGHLVLPALLGLSPTLSQSVNGSLAAGTFTGLFSLQKLGSGASYNPLPSQSEIGQDLGHAPKLDGTDVWPTVMTFNFPLPQSYLVDNTWVTTVVTSMPLYLPGVLGLGAPGSVVNPFSTDPSTLGVNLSHVVISMQLDAAHQKATNGIISGVITTADLVATIKAQAGQIDPSYCDPTTPVIAALLTTVNQASDTGSDGLQNPLSPCDGITLGLGFEASVVQIGAAVAAPSVSPCPDAGPDAASSSSSSNSSSSSSSTGSSSASTSGSSSGSSSGAGGSDAG